MKRYSLDIYGILGLTNSCTISRESVDQNRFHEKKEVLRPEIWNCNLLLRVIRYISLCYMSMRCNNDETKRRICKALCGFNGVEKGTWLHDCEEVSGVRQPLDL